MAFSLPITYNPHKKELATHIAVDLELAESSSSSSIYFLASPPSSSSIQSQMAQWFTTDVAYLRDTQRILKQLDPSSPPFAHPTLGTLGIKSMTLSEFLSKFGYISYDSLEWMNRSEPFLQCLSMYSLISPIIALVVPILMLIIPFVIMKFKGLLISWEQYVVTLKTMAKNHAIGKLVSLNRDSVASMQPSEMVNLAMSVGMFIYSLFQNVMLCRTFHSNMREIHEYFNQLKPYLVQTMDAMRRFDAITQSMATYLPFIGHMRGHYKVLADIAHKINEISEYRVSVAKGCELGKIARLFYELKTNAQFSAALSYSDEFNEYIGFMQGIAQSIQDKRLNFTTFIKEDRGNKEKGKGKEKKRITQFKRAYYAPADKEGGDGGKGTIVKNTVKLDKHVLITGPNASGKTTVLKMTLINIILSQQLGCGFFDSATLTPYHHLHCYLNIPDTSGRDSLFQAEARRCKEIITSISTHSKKQRHFCALDELYSGTNPTDAETCAISFMNYIQSFPNVSSILTTHFTQVCDQLNGLDTICNCKMGVVLNKDKDKAKGNDSFTFTYKMSPGISRVCGGVKVLTDMGYPETFFKK
jgi:hypothetical protein